MMVATAPGEMGAHIVDIVPTNTTRKMKTPNHNKFSDQFALITIATKTGRYDLFLHRKMDVEEQEEAVKQKLKEVLNHEETCYSTWGAGSPIKENEEE